MAYSFRSSKINRRELLFMGGILGGSLLTGANALGDSEFSDFINSILANSLFPSPRKLLDPLFYNVFRPDKASSLYRYGSNRIQAEFTPNNSKPMNIILFDIDTLRRDTAAFGNDSQMPMLEGLMRKKGALVFTNAVANGSYTRPSSISMCSGFLPHQIYVGRKSFSFKGNFRSPSANLIGDLKEENVQSPEVIERLRALGYFNPNYSLDLWFSGICRDIDIGNKLREIGYDTFLLTANDFTLYDRREGYNVQTSKVSSSDLYFEETRFGKFLDSAREILFSKREKPVFLMINPLEMHNPRERRYNIKDNLELRAIKESVGFSWDDFGYFGNALTMGSKINDRACKFLYNYCARRLDQEITMFLERIYSDSELSQNTLVIFTSDHGEEFNNYREIMNQWVSKNVFFGYALDSFGCRIDLSGYTHGLSFSRDDTQIPLAIMGPNIIDFKINSSLVSHTDIAATIFAQGFDVKGLEGSNLLSPNPVDRSFVMTEDSMTDYLGIGVTYTNGDVVQIFPFEDPRDAKNSGNGDLDFSYGPNPHSIFVESGKKLRRAKLSEIGRVLSDIKKVYPTHPMIPNLEKILS